MPPQSPRRILVLDDDEILRDLLQALLSLEGFLVTTTSTGAQALDLLHSGPAPELVLTDCNMPGLEGAALATELRRNLPPGALLFGMSGSPQPDATRALFDAFLPKPFDAAALTAALTQAQTHSLPSQPDAHQDPQPDANTLPPPPLDQAIYTALSASIPAAQLRQLYTMTIDDIGKRHARMVAAAAAGDTETLHREAHTIKGSCGFVGASELQALAASLETAAFPPGTTPGTSALEKIPAACLRLRSMLKV